MSEDHPVWWDDLEFKVYDPSVTAWNEVGAVYIFVRHVQEEWYAEYVGQTENLKKRLSDHDKWGEAFSRGVNQVHARTEQVEWTRLNVESRLIQRYRPPLNLSG